ncbi:MAG: hypothetical protein J6M93_04675 [Succinivibrio sp.]|nr:hypothetical protein [Succinivibrio sp.]
MSEPSYFPKDGDYASLIEELGQQQLREIEKQRLQSVAEHQKHSQQAPASYARLKPLHSDTIKMDPINYQNAREQDRQFFSKSNVRTNSDSGGKSQVIDLPKQQTRMGRQAFGNRPQATVTATDDHDKNMRTFRTVAFFIILACCFVLSEFETEDDLTVFLVVLIVFFLVAVFGSFRRKKTGA